MLVAEVTKTDLQKTRYQVESKDDISKTRQGYEIETTDGTVVQFSEAEGRRSASWRSRKEAPSFSVEPGEVQGLPADQPFAEIS
ncbi:MAG: hypothetical protein ACLFTE_09680 [Salinivenus sp.]